MVNWFLLNVSFIIIWIEKILLAKIVLGQFGDHFQKPKHVPYLSLHKNFNFELTIDMKIGT